MRRRDAPSKDHGFQAESRRGRSRVSRGRKGGSKGRSQRTARRAGTRPDPGKAAARGRVAPTPVPENRSEVPEHHSGETAQGASFVKDGAPRPRGNLSGHGTTSSARPVTSVRSADTAGSGSADRVDETRRRRLSPPAVTPVDGSSSLTGPPARQPHLALGNGSTPVEVSAFTCGGLEDVEPQALGISYWFDAIPDGDPYSVSVQVAGRLRGRSDTGRRDAFSVVTTVDDVVPGSGRVVVTTRVPDVPSGTWDVTATPVRRAPGSSKGWVPVADTRLPRASASGTAVYAPVVQVMAPGVRLGAWPALVGTGTVLALLTQSLLGERLGVDLGRLLPLSVAACLLGLLGAKAYFLLTHLSARHSLLAPGMSVQGFVLVAITTMLGGSWLLDLPAGAVLDVTTPGLLFGMTVGRLGCLLGGCCAGRPTSSRWGVWSSDRRLGVSRIPVQLLESSLAGLVATLTLFAILQLDRAADGLVFVAGLAAYTAGRQMLFPLRGEPRATRHGRMAVLAFAGGVAMTATAVLLVR